MGVVFILGFVQALFMVLILLNKKGKGLPDKILVIWIFAMGCHLCLHYIYDSGHYLNYPQILWLSVPLPLIYGPLLIFYVTALIDQRRKIQEWLWLNFLPAICYYLYLLPQLFLSREELLDWIDKTESDEPLLMAIFGLMVEISGPIYILWSLILLRNHRINIRNNFSNTEKINLLWLRNIIIGMALIWGAVLITNLTDDKTGSNIIFSTVTLFIFLIGYFGSRQGSIFTDNLMEQPSTLAEPQAKYSKSALRDHKAKQYYDQLISYMEDEKPYLESRITLPQLANRMDLNPNYLSQVINDRLNQNFYEFINSYRVEEFKRRLQTKTAATLTLLAHGRESGFASKSSFNEVFKKLTGQTPSQYWKQLNRQP